MQVATPNWSSFSLNSEASTPSAFNTDEPVRKSSHEPCFYITGRLLLARVGDQRLGGAWLLRPGISDVNLFRDCERVIDLDAQISDSAFDLSVPEQQLDRPQISSTSIDQGSFGAPQRMCPV